MVARKAHNLEVPGSNPGPATKEFRGQVGPFFFDLDDLRGTRRVRFFLSRRQSDMRSRPSTNSSAACDTRSFIVAGIVALALLANSAPAAATHHYTDRQIEIMAERVGKPYWTQVINGKGPTFLSAPSANAPTFDVDSVESVQLTELVGRAAKTPFYKFKFDNGKEGYLRPESFIEELNVTILTVDPLEADRRRAAETAAADKERIAWIHAQPWAPAVKEAAIRKQPPPGLNMAEIKRILGQPTRTVKVRGPIKTAEEQWFYPDGRVLIFHNQLLSRIDQVQKK